MGRSAAWRQKLREWLARYLPLEIAATVTALAGGLGAALITDDAIVIAYAGALAENTGFYALAIGREMRSADRHGLVASVRRVAWEFGVAEALDSLVLRPLAMYWATVALGSLGAGIVVGKVLADLAFYAIAILFYERSKVGTPEP